MIKIDFKRRHSKKALDWVDWAITELFHEYEPEFFLALNGWLCLSGCALGEVGGGRDVCETASPLCNSTSLQSQLRACRQHSYHIWEQSLKNTCVWLRQSSELPWQTLRGHADIQHVSQTRDIVVTSLKLSQRKLQPKFSVLNLCFPSSLFELTYKHIKCCIQVKSLFLILTQLTWRVGRAFFWLTCTCLPVRHISQQWEDWIRRI